MPRRPHEKLPTDPSLLEGLTKAAILLLTLDSLQAAAVLKQMSAEGVEEVTRELAGQIKDNLSAFLQGTRLKIGMEAVRPCSIMGDTWVLEVASAKAF